MRKYIDIATKLMEADIIKFPRNPKPISNLAVAGGGAEIRGFPVKVPLDDFQKAYVVCALWSSMTDDGDPLDDDYGIADIASPALQAMAADCDDFQKANANLLELYYRKGYDESQAGHDFWLTRNRHGAGFWDRGLGTLGKKLTDAAQAYGGTDLYVGDDGMIHIN